MPTKEQLKCVLLEHGKLYVVFRGVIIMQRLSADS